MAASNITAQRLRELLHYDPETGEFTNLTRRAPAALAGAQPGTVMKKGYRRIQLDGVFYMAHRLVWLYVHGVHPADQVDHINGEKDDNRIANLRTVTQSQNSQNQRKAKRSNKVGSLGVSRERGTKRFVAQIGIGGKPHKIGTFATVEEAHAAYLEWKRRHHDACTI